MWTETKIMKDIVLIRNFDLAIFLSVAEAIFYVKSRNWVDIGNSILVSVYLSL